MKSWDIVAYVFNAEILCRPCMRRKAAFSVEAMSINSEFVGVEDLLDIVAKSRGIDREDEHSFDSDEFPKVVFLDQIGESETCDNCGEEII